jgi:hypothetical protein
MDKHSVLPYESRCEHDYEVVDTSVRHEPDDPDPDTSDGFGTIYDTILRKCSKCGKVETHLKSKRRGYATNK